MSSSRATKTICAQREVFKIVGQGVLGPAAVSANVVEWRVDRHEAELTFVEIVAVDSEIVVLGKGQMRRELMREAGVPSVVGFGKRRSVAARAGADGSSGSAKSLKMPDETF